MVTAFEDFGNKEINVLFKLAVYQQDFNTDGFKVIPVVNSIIQHTVNQSIKT